MAKILLISANITKEPFPVFPLGMAAVAHDVRRRGHKVIEWDFQAEDESTDKLLDLVSSEAPDIIGLSLRNIDNCNSQHTAFYCDFYSDIVKELRTRTNSTIVLGGPGFSLFPEILVEKIGADYGIEGEGETVFASLIDELMAGNKPEEKILRSSIPLAGDEIKAPERDQITAAYYISRGGMLNIQTKRGCPFRCAYCTYPALEGKFYRHRPATDVADEIEMLIKKNNLAYYFIADSVFNDVDKRYLKIAEELIRRKITLPWMAYFKPDRFTTDEVALLKASGLQAVEWGTDCSSDTTLKGMNKSFSWADVEASNSCFSSAGIASAHFIIFGGPDETEKTVEEGLANIARLDNCIVFAATGVRVLPKTLMHQRAIDDGLITSDNDLLEPFFYYSPATSREFLHDAISKSFASRVDRIYPMGEDTSRVEAFHKMGYTGPIWDLLLGRKEGRTRRRVTP
jgi:radical SAM superfamily enzyme YgiQ (UPF0313 family)